jgi:hypothetical protein
LPLAGHPRLAWYAPGGDDTGLVVALQAIDR